jgi:hypothetical protein
MFVFCFLLIKHMLNHFLVKISLGQGQENGLSFSCLSESNGARKISLGQGQENGLSFSCLSESNGARSSY